MNKPTNGKFDKVTETYWNNVDAVLKERGMAWKELATKLGVDPRTISSKKASRSNVSIGSATEMEEALGTSIDRLVYGGTNTQ